MSGNTRRGQLPLTALALVVVGFLAVVAGSVAMWETPGTTTPVDSDPAYDYCGSIVVEGTAANAAINGDTYDEEITRSGLLSLSFAGMDSALAWAGASQVRANWELSGAELDTPITDREEIGTLRPWDTHRTEFCATKLPAGEYTVTLDLVWDDGRDQMDRTVTINEHTVTG